jgi:hypothetical protein
MSDLRHYDGSIKTKFTPSCTIKTSETDKQTNKQQYNKTITNRKTQRK